MARCGAACRGTACLGTLSHKTGIRLDRHVSFAQESMPPAQPVVASAVFQRLGPAADDQEEVAPEQPEERYGRGFRYLPPIGNRPGEPLNPGALRELHDVAAASRASALGS